MWSIEVEVGVAAVAVSSERALFEATTVAAKRSAAAPRMPTPSRLSFIVFLPWLY